MLKVAMAKSSDTALKAYAVVVQDMIANLQFLQELVLLLRNARNDTYDTQDCAKKHCGYSCSLAVWKLHD